MTNKDLKAITELLKPINDCLDKMDNRLDIIEMKQGITSKKLDDLKFDVKIAERNIRKV